MRCYRWVASISYPYEILMHFWMVFSQKSESNPILDLTRNTEPATQWG